MLMCNGLLSCVLFHTKHIGSPDGTTGHRGPSGVPLSPLGPGNVQPQPPGCQCSCLMFGKSGRHAIHYGSARFITRQRGTEMKPSMAKYKEPAMRKSVVVWRWPAAVSGRAAKLSANRHKLLRFCSPRHLAISHYPITHYLATRRARRAAQSRPCGRCLLCIVVPMYSLRTQEKLDAERNQDSSRQILWKNLSDKKKSGRMVRRIYNKTRCASCRTDLAGKGTPLITGFSCLSCDRSRLHVFNSASK